MKKVIYYSDELNDDFAPRIKGCKTCASRLSRSTYMAVF